MELRSAVAGGAERLGRVMAGRAWTGQSWAGLAGITTEWRQGRVGKDFKGKGPRKGLSRARWMWISCGLRLVGLGRGQGLGWLVA
jgi:hypothetical protein